MIGVGTCVLVTEREELAGCQGSLSRTKRGGRQGFEGLGMKYSHVREATTQCLCLRHG